MEEKDVVDNTIRVQAAISELQATNSMLVARNMELAGELAVLRAKIRAQEEQNKKE